MAGKRVPTNRRSKTANNLPPKRKKRRDRSLPPEDADKNCEPIETLGYPIKSPLDPKCYKVIRLRNGLRAVLISDCDVPSENFPKDKNGVDKRVLEFNKKVLHIGQDESEESKECDTTEFTDNGNNQRQSYTLSRKHGSASVCLSVGVGSFNDPKEYLGMAHFCEHMMLLASEKYPIPGEFEMFLTANGGESNGTTGGNRTRYFMNMKYEQEAFLSALDRFSDIFISPIMNLRYIRKERQIVDSEFQDKRNGGYEKRISILQSCGKVDHPICQFSWGNMKTLQPPDGKDKTLLAAVRKFHRENYSAEHMTIGIEIPEPLTVIEKMVAEYFSAIPNKRIPQLSLTDRMYPFDTDKFRKFYYVASKQDTDWLHITWELPPERLDDYKLKTMDYLGSILGSDQAGSLGYYLRERYLISAIVARVGVNAHEATECSNLFHIYFQLTKFGMRNVLLVLDTTFAYIKFLNKSEPQKRVFDESQIIQAINLHYRQDNLAIDLDDSLRYFPPEHIIVSKTLALEWNPANIQQYLRLLIPSRANFMLTSKYFDFCEQLEPYFNTHFHVSDVPPTLLRRLETVKIRSIFKPLLENRFIPTDFKTVPLPDKKNEMTHPCLILKGPSFEFWHIVGSTEAVSTRYNLALMSPVSTNCIQSVIILDILVAILNRSSMRNLSGAFDAGTFYGVYAIDQGILIMANGFPQKLDLIMDYILQILFYDKVWEVCDNFHAAKDRILLRYFNALMNPESLNRQLQERLCENNNWTTMEKHQTLSSLNFQGFKASIEKYVSRFEIIGFTQGNLSAKTARDFANKILAKRRWGGFPGKVEYKQSAYQIPLGETILRVRNMNKLCNTTFVSNLYQIGPGNPFTALLCDYFSNAMPTIAFQKLREVEKLCYSVNVEAMPISTANGICISLCTQSDRFSANHIMRRINNFMKEYYYEHVEKMTTEEFRGMKQYHCNHDDLCPNTQWKHIQNRDLNFLAESQQSKMVEKVTIEDVIRWYQKYLISNTKCRKSLESSELRMLSVQVVGVADKEFKVESILGPGLTAPRKKGTPILRNSMCKIDCARQHPNPMNPLVILLPELSDETMHIRKKCVVDIHRFRSSLPIYPEEESDPKTYSLPGKPS